MPRRGLRQIENDADPGRINQFGLRWASEGKKTGLAMSVGFFGQGTTRMRSPMRRFRPRWF
jgi:hypothetical protein